MSKLVTFENVAKAAENITAEGRRPSVRSVIDELGGGSPNAVLPLLNEWKSGRPSIHASDIELDPQLSIVVKSMIAKASEQAAKAAEERASDVQADAEAIAEAGREAESRAVELEALLEDAKKTISDRDQALEIARSTADQAATVSKEKLLELDKKLMDERERADATAKALARAEVKLEQVPALEAEVKRLAQFEKEAAVLTASLESANSLVSDLKQRLSDMETKAQAAVEDASKQAREAEKARIAEQAAQARIESAAKEAETQRSIAADAKADIKALRAELAEVRAELKQVRTAAGKVDKPEAK